MKPTLIFVLVMVAVSSTGQIPSNVVKEFERIHPDARYVEWKKEWGLLEDYYKVTYTNWYRQVLVFNRKGEIIISESELPLDYIPNQIHEYMRKNYSHVKYVVWDSFDRNNNRSYFVISNQNKKLLFSNQCEFQESIALSKPKKQKQNLLSIFTPKK
jgi:hypothetical protein